MLENHRFDIEYCIHGISYKTNIDAVNQREAYCKLYYGLAKQGFTFSEIKVVRISRYW